MRRNDFNTDFGDSGHPTHDEAVEVAHERAVALHHRHEVRKVFSGCWLVQAIR